MKKIAVTGAFGSGKSIVCQVFKNHGAFVVNSDDITHQLYSPGTPHKQEIIELLGPEVVENGQFNRKKIAEIVFKDSKKLEALEKLLHPSIINAISALYEEVNESKKTAFFVVEMPLLFEIHQQDFYDVVICVDAEKKRCLERIKASGFTEEDYETRMARQLPPLEKCKRSDKIIHNNGSIDELKSDVEMLIKELQ